MTTRYLLDTNILVEAIRGSATWEGIKIRFDPMMADLRPVYNSVTEGELRALSEIFESGPDKTDQMEFLFGYFVSLPIEHPQIMLKYSQIDSAARKAGRRMGKNDLWIAATACAEKLILLTTDRDFDAISPRFIQREWIDPG